MDWTRTIDGYCERTDPSYWSEPINAVTNLAFILVAVFMWRRTAGYGEARFLSAVLFVIGVGSYLFHTHATAWSAVLDVLPIILFSLTYIFLANRDYWKWPIWLAFLGTIAYFPYSAAVAWAASHLPFFNISAEYWALPLMIGAYGFALRGRLPETANGLTIGAGILSVSLTARSLDELLCSSIPSGTHFLWHILNAIMLGWMIEVWWRHTQRSDL
ncbi:MAG: ceramidase domain-containing protein [Boseongicola sp.]|nr:ceramidase domain-containing protein [Boseongicola sp.]MDD9978077.1 ceramidase domain-containing protein [Boseongicola sp.]